MQDGGSVLAPPSGHDSVCKLLRDNEAKLLEGRGETRLGDGWTQR